MTRTRNCASIMAVRNEVFRCQLPPKHSGPHVAEGNSYGTPGQPWRVMWARYRGSTHSPLPPVQQAKVE